MKTSKQWAQDFDRDPNIRASFGDEGLSETMEKRVMFQWAKIQADLWPGNALQAHRYALRKLAMMGEWSIEAYEELVSGYVNDPNNW
jgi:hypothetical protein